MTKENFTENQQKSYNPARGDEDCKIRNIFLYTKHYQASNSFVDDNNKADNIL